MIGENNTITTYRMVETSGQHAYSATPTLTNHSCALFTADTKLAASIGHENAFEVFSLYVDQGTDILRGDRVVDRDGLEYTVNGVQNLPSDEIEGVIEVVLLLKTR